MKPHLPEAVSMRDFYKYSDISSFEHKHSEQIN